MIKLIFKIILISIGFTILQWYQWWGTPYDQVYFIDVGQGDSALIIKSKPCQQKWCQFFSKKGLLFYEKQVVVIDGGSNMSVLPKITNFLPWWKQKIDLVIVTHPHLDHYFGVIELQERYHISQLWLSMASSKSPLYQYFLNNIKGSVFKGNLELSNTQTNTVKRGFDWLKVWFPIKTSDNILATKNTNNGSLVVLATLQNKQTILFMGDLEKEGENILMEYLQDTTKIPILQKPVTILKAGHHCSKTASQRKFIQLIKPKIAICSLGKNNPYHHPHQETLQTFKQLGVHIMRTDKDGTIKYR